MNQRIVPFIGYEDAARAIEWLEAAFGFRENRDARYEENRTITHAELQLVVEVVLEPQHDVASGRDTLVARLELRANHVFVAPAVVGEERGTQSGSCRRRSSHGRA